MNNTELDDATLTPGSQEHKAYMTGISAAAYGKNPETYLLYKNSLDLSHWFIKGFESLSDGERGGEIDREGLIVAKEKLNSKHCPQGKWHTKKGETKMIKTIEKREVVGFSIHFHNYNRLDIAGVKYFVSEPAGTNNYAMMLSGQPNYVAGDYRQSEGERFHVGHFILNGVHELANWDRLRPAVYNINTADGSLSEQYFFNTTPNGMYVIAKDAFDHVDPRFTYSEAKKYVGKVACFKGINTNETAALQPAMFYDDYANSIADMTYDTTNGSVIVVESTKQFIDGWYGIGMSQLVYGTKAPIDLQAGFTFVYHLSDGSEKTFIFDGDIYAGNWCISAPKNWSAPLNSGRIFALFNPNLGLVNVYNEDPKKSPFYARASDQHGFYNYKMYLQGDISPSLTPIRSFNAYSGG